MKQNLIDLVDHQFKAFNNKNLKEFCSVFAEDILVTNLTEKDFSLRGIAAFREHHEDLFNKFPNSQAKLLKRMSQGNFLFDQEEITGLGPEPVRLTVVYEMGQRGIKNLWIYV